MYLPPRDCTHNENANRYPCNCISAPGSRPFRLTKRQHGDGGFVREHEGLRSLGRRFCRHCRRRAWAAADAPSAHWFSDILQVLRTHILEGYIELAADLPVSVVGDADAARLSNSLQPRCDVDAVAKDIIFIDDDVADVDADAKFDPLALRYIDILFGHTALNFDGAACGLYGAAELDESAVPGILDDAPVMISDFGIKKRLSKSFQLRQRAFFVDPNQAARASDIRRQNSRQSPLYVLAAQDAPHAREIECSYSR